MKSNTKWYEDVVWLMSLASIILWPIGFCFGIIFVGLYSGFKSAERTFLKVSTEYTGR